MFVTRQLLRFARESYRRLAVVSFLELVSTLFSTLVMLLSSFAVQMLMGVERIMFFSELWQVFLGIFLLTALRFMMSKFKTVEAIQCSLEIKKKLRVKLLKKLYVLGPAYTGRKRTGELTTTLWSRVEWLDNYYGKYWPAVSSAIVNAAIILCVICAFDWITGLVALHSTLGVLLCPMLFFRLMNKRGGEEWSDNAKYYSDCLDGIQGISTLKSFNANGRQKEKIHVQGEKLRKSIMRHLNVTIVENCMLEFFARFGSAVTIVVAAMRFLGGYIAADMLIYSLFLTTACFKPMFSMITAWHIGYRGVTGALSIADLLSQTTALSLYSGDGGDDGTQTCIPAGAQPFAGDIRFENVGFSYSKSDGEVLRGISFTVPHRSVTALVGPSGSGKSTIAHLLSGFYRADTGVIRVGGKTLDENSVSHIQDNIAAVWQDSHIFFGTCYDNILIGNPEATQEQVIRAAKAANIHDFIISLDKGYGTILGERGARLSGGERQRIAIARAFLRDVPIVIFDEATSALDRKNEMEVQSSFRNLIRGKTTLVIAHRLETICDADQICIIDKGKIVGMGTHEDLMSSSQLYQKLMGNQVSASA